MICDAPSTRVLSAVLLMVGTIALVQAAAQELPPPAKDVPLESCATAQCHGEVKDFPVVHSPVDADTCDACHALTDAASHKFDLAEEETKLCASCHELEIEDAKVVHEPVANGNCLACHNPHGGADRFSLRGESLAEACYECHDDLTEDKKAVHGPVAAGACNACHKPHAGEFENLLIAEGRELCVSCHTEVSDALEDIEFPHEAMEGDCTDCHDPHASDNVAHINQPPAELCLGCHDDIADLVSEAKYKHSAVTAGDACVNCHNPHGGDRAKLLKDKPINFCLACHDKEIPRAEGNAIASMAEVLDPKKVKHGPILEGNCTACHNVHGSELASLLTKPFPKAFYAPFKVDLYELCFGCHESQLALAPETDKATGFRDGRRNLHYVHVNKRKGRSCGVCHSIHASSAASLLRASVPFGKWSLPINYKATKTGGSCAGGCHQKLSYDRQKPVNPNSQP